MMCPVKEKWSQGLPIVIMILLAVTRWPGMLPNNFSAVYGMAFCAGVYFSGWQRWYLPLGTFFITDVLMNVFYYHVAPISAYVTVNYLAYLAIIWLGKKYSHRASWLSLVGGGLWGALIFYFVTNTASWLQNPEYAKTLAGWVQALTRGTPGWPPTWEFFRNTLLSGGLFAGLFAGAMKLSEAPEEEPEEEADGSAEEPAARPEESKA